MLEDNELKQKQRDIIDAISCEIDESSKPLNFEIKNSVKDGDIWRITIDTLKDGSRGLDESLEGSAAWWPGPPKGYADVLSVIADDEEINLRFANVSVPNTGKLRIYPPLYLENLKQCWQTSYLANRSLTWLEFLKSDSNNFDKQTLLQTRNFPWLRKRQAAAFQLLGYKVSFLWGPPGTGKTTTLGAILAQFLLDFPKAKILLLSTTNSAVDQALISVDESLKQLSPTIPLAKELRKKCFRVGNHFIASNYADRQHLIPVKDDTLIKELTKLEANRPDKSDVHQYAKWKKEIEIIRNKIKSQASGILDNASLAAMTTTRAIFTFADLEKRPYNLIVFDEASQVGLAHALMLAPIGQKVLFAGDPKQLAPIVQSPNASATRWLGNSIFKYMKEKTSSTCMLTEQSRMAEPICKIVSDIFYNSELVVAEDCKKNRKWLEERTLPFVNLLGSKNVNLYSITEEGDWSRKYSGNIRYKSAELIRDLVCKIVQTVDQKDIIVLTPFRAQRTLVKSFLKHANCKQVSVSTVHRAQGSERHTVIFDPVVGSSDFLKTEDAPRLINVALSRAQARLVVIFSPGDLNNPLLNQIANIIENRENAKDAIPIAELVSSLNFPNNSIGKVVQIKDTVGRVSGISEDGISLCLLNFKTGQTIKFKIDTLKQNFQKISEKPIKPNKVENSSTAYSVNSSSPIPIARLISTGNFPDSALGKLVQIQDIIGWVRYVAGNRQTFLIEEAPHGKMLTLNTYEVIKRVSETSLEKKVIPNNPPVDNKPKKVFVVGDEKNNSKVNNTIQPQSSTNTTVKQPENKPKTTFRGETVTDISVLIYKPNFPRCAMGQLTQIDNKVGKIIKVSANEQTFIFQDYKTSQKYTYDVVRVMAIYGKK